MKVQTMTTTLDDAKKLLNSLHPARADRYEDWTTVGMALHAEFGHAGLPLWESWSQRSEKIKQGECERKWKTFKTGGNAAGAVRYGTLVEMARQDGAGAIPRPAANGAAAKPKTNGVAAKPEVDWRNPIRVHNYGDTLRKAVYKDGAGKRCQWQHLNGRGWEKGYGGQAPGLYRQPTIERADPAELVYLSESEKDADVLAGLGLLATSHPGGATEDLKPDHLKVLAGRRVAILAHNDEPGRKWARAQGQALAQAGAEVRIVWPDVGGWDCEAGGDVADLVARLGSAEADIVREILEQKVTAAEAVALEGEKPIFRPLSLADLFNQPDKVWLWSDLIGAGDIAMIFGESGTAKTFATIDLIVSGALGLPFAGQFDPARPLRIAYCAGEGINGIKGRFKAALNKYRASTQALDVQVFTAVPQLFDDNSPEYVGRFVGELSDQAGQLDVIFIDTLHSATAGGDENSAKDAGVILRNAKYISEALRVTVILVHHANKAGGYRGSSALHGAMDTMIQTRQEGEIFTLECFKQKDAERFRKLFFRLTPDGFSQSAYVEWAEADTIDLNRDDSTAAAQALEDIIKILQTSAEPLNQSDIVRLSKIGRNNTLAALKTLENDGTVWVHGVGKAKVYTLSPS